MRLLYSIILSALLAVAVNATPTSMQTRTKSGRMVTVTAINRNILRVDNLAPGERAKVKLVDITPANHAASVTSNNDYYILSTNTGITARLDKNSGEVTVSASNGRGIYDDGVREINAKGHRTMKLLPLDNSKVFYGGGERGYSLNLANDTLVMYNRQNYGYNEGELRIKQMNITMPLLISPKGYAILMDDYAAAEMLTESPLTYTTESPDAVSYYFINSPDGFSALPKELSALTGRQDLPPFWALGYITSKYGYKTAAETDSVVNALKRGGYPLDGIVLDLYWYGCEQDMGRLAWESAQWGDHRKMLANLKKKGVNLTAISQPYVLRNGKGIENYRELASKGMFGKDSEGGVKNVEIWVGEGGMLDVSNPDTRKWLRNRYKQLTDEGITGWWGDLGEPEKHPEGMFHANGLTTRQYHNMYGNDWSSIIYDLFRDEYPDTRLMTLMRGGTVGLQRYSVFPWSTDVSRSWGGLQPQVRIMLNSGMSGLGYMSHDVGGFAIDQANPVDPELYVRWLQLGVFSPVLRTHAQQTAEPFHYPEQRSIILPLIKARYKWLPYNYTLAYENASAGMPLVRPVGMYDENPVATASVDNQYLWGRDIMVAPVLQKGATSRMVKFPQGIWVDFNNPMKQYGGETEAKVNAPLDVLPLFVRAGALIPMADYKMENTLQYTTGRYTIHYFPVNSVEESSFSIFEDDRKSPRSLKNGEYAFVNLKAKNTDSHINIMATVEGGKYEGMPKQRNLTFVMHNVDKPASVKASVGVKHKYNAATRTLTIKASKWDALKALEITVAKKTVEQKLSTPIANF